MLYISRYVRDISYGVVDTDDFNETIVPEDVVHDAVLKAGLTIGGVSKVGYVQFGDYSICEIFPYQPPETFSQLQIKTNLIKHTSVLVWKNIITSVRWRANEIKEPVSIRLSDFGRVLGDRFLCGNSQTDSHKITIILDDKLEFERNSFWRPMALDESAGIKFDIRELTRESAAELFYLRWVVHDGSDSRNKRVRAVIDSDDRKNSMMRRFCGR